MKHLFFFIALLWTVIINGDPLQLTLSAQAAILVNADTGKVLFAKNPYDKHPPASLAKIPTSLVALNKNPDFLQMVKSPRECLVRLSQKTKIERNYEDPPYRLEPDGKMDGIYEGEYLTIRDLFYGMLIASASDATNVLTNYLSGGDIGAFMKEVNAYIHAIGCKDTVLYNPHGLHHPKQVTTAYDMALIGCEAIKNKELVDIVSRVNYERPQTNKQPARTVWSTNRLLRKGPLRYSKAFGIKSGNHAAVGYNFVGAARDENRTLVSVVLHCVNAAAAYQDTIKMFTAAFAEKKITRQLFNCKESIFKVKIKGTRQALQAVLAQDVIIEYFPSEEELIVPHLTWNKLSLPIQKGDQVGSLLLQGEDKFSQIFPIYAMDNLAPSFKWRYPLLIGLLLVIAFLIYFIIKRRIEASKTYIMPGS